MVFFSYCQQLLDPGKLGVCFLSLTERHHKSWGNPTMLYSPVLTRATELLFINKLRCPAHWIWCLSWNLSCWNHVQNESHLTYTVGKWKHLFFTGLQSAPSSTHSCASSLSGGVPGQGEGSRSEHVFLSFSTGRKGLWRARLAEASPLPFRELILWVAYAKHP